MALIVGVAGPQGAGKGTAIKKLSLLSNKKRIKIESIKFSDILSDVLDTMNIPRSRENYQKLIIALKNSFGGDVLTKALKTRVLKMEADLIVIDGVRWEPDYEFLRSFPSNTFIYVTARQKERFKRCQKRGEKSGEDAMTWEEFKAAEERETEKFIPEIGKRADFRIINDTEDDDGNRASGRLLEEKVSDIFFMDLMPKVKSQKSGATPGILARIKKFFGIN